MAAGARTNAAAPLSGPSGAAGDATMRRGAQTSRRISMTLRPARGLLYSPAATLAALDALSKPRGLDWEATMALVRVLGLAHILWSCFAGRGKWTRKASVH